MSREGGGGYEVHRTVEAEEKREGSVGGDLQERVVNINLWL